MPYAESTIIQTCPHKGANLRCQKSPLQIFKPHRKSGTFSAGKDCIRRRIAELMRQMWAGAGMASRSIMWGPWAVGMASDPLAAKHLEKIGLAVIPAKLGLQALAMCLQLLHVTSHPDVRHLSQSPL